MPRIALHLALALLLVLAGCNAGGPASPTQTTTEQPQTSPTETATTTQPPTTTSETARRTESVAVYGDDLPVNATTVYLRVERLLGVDGDPPDVIVRQRSALSESGNASATGDFGKRLGIRGTFESVPSHFTATTGYMRYPDVVIVVSNESTAAGIETTLVHEFTHALLNQHANVTETAPANATMTDDRILAGRTIYEGAPTYVTDAYIEQYLPNVPSQSATMREHYDEVPSGIQYYWTWSLSGARYVEQRANGTQNVTQVYEQPPWTTEQVLHGLSPAAERPVSLDPSIDAADGWRDAPRTTRGELFLRAALETQLGRDRAAEAATGWGNDVLVPHEHENQTAYAWVLRWDSSAEADEFEAALLTYLDRRATERSGVWHAENATFRTERLDSRTVALYVGPEAFVENTTASDW